jgi:hypothetical protein
MEFQPIETLFESWDFYMDQQPFSTQVAESTWLLCSGRLQIFDVTWSKIDGSPNDIRIEYGYIMLYIIICIYVCSIPYG